MQCYKRLIWLTGVCHVGKQLLFFARMAVIGFGIFMGVISVVFFKVRTAAALCDKSVNQTSLVHQ